MKIDYHNLEKKIKNEFKNKNLLIKSLTHKSFDKENNNVIVGPKEFLSCNKIKISDCNWLIDLQQDSEFRVLVKLRNSSQPVIGTIKVSFDNAFAYLLFDQPQFGVSTGQAAVFYNIKESSHILGGGWIKEAPNKSIDIKLYNA